MGGISSSSRSSREASNGARTVQQALTLTSSRPVLNPLNANSALPSFPSFSPVSARLASQASPRDPVILQFTSALYFVEEDEGSLEIDVMRLGSQRGRVSCLWSTADGSGKADVRYEADEGELVFEDGEYRQTISVDIINESQWNATLEFKVCLSEPEGCTLGQYLHTCRVKVIDGDLFPTSKFPEVAQGMDAIKTIGTLSLFWEYCKMNFGVPGVAWRTMTCLLFDQMKNVYLFFKLSWMAYMLNDIFHEVGDTSWSIDDRVTAATWVGVGYILPMFALHIWDLIRVRIDVSGLSRLFLQQSIVRKYLNYNEESRSDVGVTDIQLAIREDCADLAEGYMAVLSILRLIGKLMVMIYFTLSENPSALKVIIIMPLLMLVFGFFRNSSLHEASEKPDDLGGDMIAYVSDAAYNYQLIADYGQRPKINDVFAQKSSAWKSASLSPKTVRVNNDYFTQWLGPVFIGLYVIKNARRVLTGALGNGTFVATLSVFSEVSGDFSEGYKELMKISSIAGGLQGVTELLNLPTDLMDWKKVNRKRRQAAKAAREEILKRAGQTHPFPTDLIEFQFKNVKFQYESEEPGAWTLNDVNLSVNQGAVIAIKGDHNLGRQSFLRLIAHKLFPTEGEIFIPTHLRILHVSLEPFILKASLLHNLAFGVHHGDVNLELIKYILRELGATRLLTELEKEGNIPVQDEDDGSDSDSEELEVKQGCFTCCVEEPEHAENDVSWMKKLTYTDKVKLHLARAFIMNPEVMVIQRPFLHFNVGDTKKVLKSIVTHSRNRGLGMPQETASMRRPRTVFMSVESDDQCRLEGAGEVWEADAVWDMNGDSSIATVKVTQGKSARSQGQFSTPPVFASPPQLQVSAPHLMPRFKSWT